MNENAETKDVSTPIWFWVIGVIALLWNLMGLMAFAVQMTRTEEQFAALSEAEQAIYNNMPSWVPVLFAVAVIGGVLGSVLLLARKKLAIPVLVLSLIGVLGQYGYMFFMSDTPAVMGAAAMALPVLVVVISIALVPYALSCRNKGQLQ